jgi:two-component system invasion response regulator UvrY
MRFLLIDDHVVVRSGLKLILSDLYKPCTIDEAEDGESAIIKLKLHFYDLVILDIKMPNTNTFTLMEYINNIHTDVKVLVFSMNSESIYAKRYLTAGAKGFVNKIAALEEIVKAINTVLSGKRYISESLLEVLADLDGNDKKSNPFDSLSPREFEIVSMLLGGEGISQIAHHLNLRVSTVGTHKARIFEKLKVTNLIELKELANSFNN